MRLFEQTMKTCRGPFNTYLWCAIALLLACGCKSTDQSKEKNPKKQLTTLRLHMQSVSGRSTAGMEVPILRSRPVLLPVDREPFVTEANVVAARVVEDGGGFSIEIQLDRQGTWLLEKFTVTNLGRQIAVFANFGEGRWLAAPVVPKIISNGLFKFTPDATREEADRIVTGLNNMAKKLKTKDNW